MKFPTSKRNMDGFRCCALEEKGIIIIFLVNILFACRIIWVINSIQWAPLEPGMIMRTPLVDEVFSLMMLLAAINITYNVWKLAKPFRGSSTCYRYLYMLYAIQVFTLLALGCLHIEYTSHTDVIIMQPFLHCMNVFLMNWTNADAVETLFYPFTIILVVIVFIHLGLLFYVAGKHKNLLTQTSETKRNGQNP